MPNTLPCSETLANILEGLGKVRDPVTKGTLKATAYSVVDTLRDLGENHNDISSFLENLTSFYGSEKNMGREGYELREDFKTIDTISKVREPNTRVMVRAMANSAVDSLRDSRENHDAVNNFFKKFDRFYWNEARKSGMLSTRRYSDLGEGERVYLYDKYQRSGMTRNEFVRSYGLSSTYALDKIRKEYGCEKVETLPISEILGKEKISSFRLPAAS